MPTKPKAKPAAAAAPTQPVLGTGDSEIDALFAGIDASPAATTNGAVVPSDAGTPDGEITTAAKDELARLAANKAEDGTAYDKVQAELAAAGGKQAKARAKAKAAAGPGTAAPSDAPTTDDSVPDSVPGLTDATPGTATRAARAKGKGKAKAKKKADPEKAAAAKAAAKLKDKEKKDKAKAREDERKAKLAASKKANAAVRASKATPAILKGETKPIQALFAQHYSEAARIDQAGKPLKVDKDGNVLDGQTSMRRPKCDRGDFAAGWYMVVLQMRKEGRTPAAAAENS